MKKKIVVSVLLAFAAWNIFYPQSGRADGAVCPPGTHGYDTCEPDSDYQQPVQDSDIDYDCLSEKLHEFDDFFPARASKDFLNEILDNSYALDHEQAVTFAAECELQ